MPTITLTYRFDVSDVEAQAIRANVEPNADGTVTARFYGHSPVGEFFARHRMPAIYASDAHSIRIDDGMRTSNVDGSDDERTLAEVNATAFARHYEAASGILLWALAEPSGDMFAYAHAEATRAAESAHDQTEQSLALALAHGIVTAALSHGYRLRERASK